MRSRNKDQFIVLQYLTDGIAVGVGLLLAYWFRFLSGIDGDATISTDYLAQFWTAFVLWMFSLHQNGCFEPSAKVISFNRARKLLKGCLLAIMLITVKNYFLRIDDVSRLLYPISFFSVMISLLVGRFALQDLIYRFFLPAGGCTRVLIAGVGPVGIRLAARCLRKPELGYELVGFAAMDESKVGLRLHQVPVLGTINDIRRLIRDNGVEEVFVTETELGSDQFTQIFLDGERENARINFVPSLIEMLRSSIRYDEVAEIPIYSMRETPLRGINAATKRFIDLAGASLGLLLLTPLSIPLIIAMKLTSRGPIFYKQTRLGLDGREFKIYKFRTMHANAEQEGPVWGKQDDQRATPLGRWLRKTNIDELPQLWNVIRGDMSLVGPRPERPYYVDRFKELFPRYMSRHSVKTGLTGWAQVHGLRGSTSIPLRLRYDLYYIENWSLWLDAKILIMTFFSPNFSRRQYKPRVGPPMTPAMKILLEVGNECGSNDLSSEQRPG